LALRESKSKEYTEMSAPLPPPHPDEVYKHANDKQTLAARFKAHLERTSAKGSVNALRPPTITTYYNGIFSKSSTKSFSKFVRTSFGKDSSLCGILFDLATESIPLDDIAVKDYISLAGGEDSAASASHQAASLRSFLVYVKAVAGQEKTGTEDIQAVTAKSVFVLRFSQLVFSKFTVGLKIPFD
jgi:hypothetical protein